MKLCIADLPSLSLKILPGLVNVGAEDVVMEAVMIELSRKGFVWSK